MNRHFEYDIQQRTAEGWETVNCESTFPDAKKSVLEYRANQPEYAYRIKRVRVETVGNE
jgi:hypothetical protein